MNTLRNENGFSVLLLALMVLLVMTALGAAMLQTTQRELKSVNKLKLSTQAFYMAESGISIAVAELNNGNWIDFNSVIADMKTGIAPTESLMLYSSDYGLNMDFEVTVEFLGADPVCWGDIDGDFDLEQHTLSEFYGAGKVAGESFWPILIITSESIKFNGASWSESGLFKRAKRKVQVMVRLDPSFTFPEAALTLNGSLVNNGTPQSSIGDGHPDDPPCGFDVADIVGTNDSILDYTGNTDVCVNPDTNEEYACHGTPDMSINPDGYPIDVVAPILVGMGTELIGNDLRNGVTVGDEDSPYDVYYYRGDIDTGLNNLSGYGILLIIGDLALGGNIDWDGMIMVTGNLTLNGGGNPDNYIHGSVIVGGDVTGNGNPDIYFDCEGVLELWKSTGRYHMKWWREVKGGS